MSSIACPTCQHSNAPGIKFCGECGARMAQSQGAEAPAVVDDALPFEIGTQLAHGRYVLQALLGRGGMGTVYRAVDMTLDRRCALKVLNAELTAHPTARKRMEREARALARIEHPHVVQVRSIFMERELLVMELEFMDGGDLRGLIERRGLQPERTATLMAGVLAGLQAIHDAQLVHRDVKPDNVLLSSQGVPKLTDLGVARDDAESHRTRTRLGAVLGTLEYMSPEQIQGLTIDARADIYACGVMLVQMLTGRLPFDAHSDFDWQEAHVRRAPDLQAARAVHPGLAAVAERALAKDPGQRWATAAKMAAAVAAAMYAKPVATAKTATTMVEAGHQAPKNKLVPSKLQSSRPRSRNKEGTSRFRDQWLKYRLVPVAGATSVGFALSMMYGIHQLSLAYKANHDSGSSGVDWGGTPYHWIHESSLNVGLLGGLLLPPIVFAMVISCLHQVIDQRRVSGLQLWCAVGLLGLQAGLTMNEPWLCLGILSGIGLMTSVSMFALAGFPALRKSNKRLLVEALLWAVTYLFFGSVGVLPLSFWPE